jgi:hypothetical protein
MHVTPHKALQLLALTSIGITIFAAATLVSLNFGLGALYASFNEKNPIRIASSQGATITFLLSIVYLVLLLVIYFYPVLMMHTIAFKQIPPYYEILWIIFVVVFVLSGVVVSVSHMLGLKALKKDF